MRFAKRTLPAAVGAIFASLLVSCGGNSTTAPANIRLVNLIPGSSASDTVTLSLNTAAYAMTAPAGGGTSSYNQVGPGTYLGEVSTAGDPLAAAYSFPGLNLGTNQSYTVFTYVRDLVLYPYVLVDNVPVPSAGEAQITIANASPDAGPLSIWILQHSSSSPADPCQSTQVTSGAGSSSAPFQNVQGQQTSPWPVTVLDSNNNQIYWDICVTGQGGAADERLSISTVGLASGQNYTVALTSGNGGTLVNGALIEQEGITNSQNTVTLYPNSNIRVRLLVSLPTLGGTPDVTMTNTTTGASMNWSQEVSGKYTPYQTLGGGSAVASATGTSSSSYTITATLGTTSVPVTIPSGFSFLPGGDYTILVYQASGATPAATVFADTNLAAQSGRANVRVVNAADYDSTGVELYVNDEAYNQTLGVAVGTASGYASVGAGTNLPVQLYSQPSVENSSSTPAGLAQDFTLNTGEVYTVFLYDLTQPPLLITDR
jgi:hypothetical protein